MILFLHSLIKLSTNISPSISIPLISFKRMKAILLSLDFTVKSKSDLRSLDKNLVYKTQINLFERQYFLLNMTNLEILRA